MSAGPPHFPTMSLYMGRRAIVRARGRHESSDLNTKNHGRSDIQGLRHIAGPPTRPGRLRAIAYLTAWERFEKRPRDRAPSPAKERHGEHLGLKLPRNHTEPQRRTSRRALSHRTPLQAFLPRRGATPGTASFPNTRGGAHKVFRPTSLVRQGKTTGEESIGKAARSVLVLSREPQEEATEPVNGKEKEFNPIDLLETPRKWRGRPRLSIQPLLRSKQEYKEAAEEEMRKLWAQSTWRRKQSVWAQYTSFAEALNGEKPKELTDGTGVAFILDTSKRIGNGAAVQYGRDLVAIRKKVMGPITMETVLRAMSAQHIPPDRIAVTMQASKCGEMIQDLPPAERSAVWLQWKTTSRWEDIMSLKAEDIIRIGTTEIAVLFGATKATRANPFRADHQLIVRHLPQIPEWVEFPREGAITKWDTARMDRWWAGRGKAEQEEMARGTTDHYTCHSIKKGALKQLVERAAAVPGFPVWLIPLLAKHVSQLEQFPQTTMGYLRHPAARMAVARLLRTQEATVLLDPS